MSNEKKKSKKFKKTKKKPIRISVLRPVLNLDRGTSCWRVAYTDLERQTRSIDIGSEIFRSPKDVAKMLLSAHAALPDDAKKQENLVKAAFANRDRNASTLVVTSRVGWHDRDGELASFVNFNRTLGPRRDTLAFDRARSVNPAFGRRAGTVKDWRNGIKEACENSDYLVLSLGIAAAGPLLELLTRKEPAIYHFHGALVKPGSDSQKKWKSSSGKTLAARLAASTIGRCEPFDLFSFDVTPRALEEICAGTNSLFMVLDEEGRAGSSGGGKQIDPNVLPYLIISGRGRDRSRIATQNADLQNLTWLLPVISTGENPLDQPGKAVRKEGAAVRMVPVPVPPTWEGGIFQGVEGTFAGKAKTRRRLAKSVETTIGNNYGVIMPKYLSKVIFNRPELEMELPTLIDAFIERAGVGNDSWEIRFAEKFAIPYVGALLLARYELAPWSEERALAAITNMYKRSRASIVSIPQATDRLLQKLRDLIDQRKRFARVPKGQALTNIQRKTLWGVIRRIDGHKKVLVVPPARLRRLVQPAAAWERVLKELAIRGALVPGADGKSIRQVMVKGFAGKKRARYVCIKGLDQARATKARVADS